MAQMSYGYRQPAAVAGGLVDTSPHSIFARSNAETERGKVKFGMGVVIGDNPGKDAKLPSAASTLAQFEGIVTTSVKQMDMQGEVSLDPTYTLGVLEWGKIWARLVSGLTIAYGDPVYLLNSGDEAGYFTNVSGGIAVTGAKFVGNVEYGDIAPVELYNQKA